ncbi:hypothetical protein IV203_010029 [Nitzschia inconspicua]|uniref:Uncharacterized protein n=1 Tax=Nitzschia inconspicua TaxID=303405 RepID=A0A9K3PMQ0_9STRA|nr:hypothetical protein IV203_010029 [Nitzschia inconspicua]
MPSMLQATCLSPKKSLRTQLFSSFGLAAFLSLFVMVVSSCIAIVTSGEDVKRYARDLMTQQVQERLIRSGELVAEKYSSRIASVEGTLQLLVEAVRDRIVGYPSEEGWEDARHVPFRDYYYDIDPSTRQEFAYPLAQPPVPLDWSVERERNSPFSDSRILAFPEMLFSTECAAYHFPGTCDPTSGENSLLCFEQNNNVTTGGIFPSVTHEGLFKATGDISVFMKPLYEADPELLNLQVLFYNDGAGSTLKFPAGPVIPLTRTYVSQGCDWITELQNPYTGKNFGTPEDAAKCRSGEVESRYYNSMETGTAEFILKNGLTASKTATSVDDAITGVAWQGALAASDNRTAILRAGKAIYDRKTNELIGFATADLLEELLSQYLKNRVLNVDADVYVVRYDTGSIFSVSPNAEYTVFEKLDVHEQIKTEMDQQLDNYLRNLKATAAEGQQDNIDQPTFLAPLPSGDIITASFLPVPPKSFFEAELYKPVAFVVQRMPVDVFRVVDDVENDIDRGIRRALFLSVSLGIGGLLLILAILGRMSAILTSPLTFITRIANQVINNALIDEDESLTMKRIHSDIEGQARHENMVISHYTASRCTPKTEVNSLVEEFQKMIKGFSGDGASNVAEPPLFQVRNELVWHSDFSKLYIPDGVTKKSLRQTSVSTETSETFSGRSQANETIMLPKPDADGEQIDSDEQLQTQSVYYPSFSSRTLQQYFGGDEGGIQDIHEDQPGTICPIPNQQESRGAGISGAVNPEARIASVRFSAQRPTMYTPNVVPAPAKINRSPVLQAPKSSAKPMLQRDKSSAKKVCSSSLFWWIVLLMAFPVLITNFIIGAIVSSTVSGSIDVSTQRAEEASIRIETQNLDFVADRKASTLSTLVQSTVRDLHVMSRITNWLFFGGIERGKSLTETDTASEECKSFVEKNEVCQSYTPERMPCACDWECPQEVSSEFGCQIFDKGTDTRFLQRQNFLVQSQEADPLTGNRRTSSGFPEHFYSPNSTHWWWDISTLPGSQKGPNAAAGYETLFDRVAVASAASVFNFPMYNYATALNKEKPYLGGYLTFEDDGLFLGWTGCSQLHIRLVAFESTVENGAPLIDPQLCPEGKFGYDPRCRSWYADGREKYLNFSIPVHVTAPYEYASSLITASSITSPIANPSTEEYVGQILYDYLPLGLGSSVRSLKEPLSFLITPGEDVIGGDTVVGPRKLDEWTSSPIADLIFPNDPVDSPEKRYFQSEIVSELKAGGKGQKQFSISREDGSKEDICLAYAPVTVEILLGIDPREFGSSVNSSDAFVYSVAVGKPCADFRMPLEKFEDKVNQHIQSIGMIYSTLNVVNTFLFVVFAGFAAMYIALPVIRLLNIVIEVNRDGSENLPPLNGGCKEIHGVYNTFSKFNKVVRVSNTAFFGNDLEMAHHFVRDALTLFRSVHDSKAIGIACNNLANTLFAIRFEQANQVQCCENEHYCSITEALQLYDEAVLSAQHEFEGAADDSEKASFATQLSDRLFNRGLFLLFVAGYDCAPEDARERGYDDVTIARNLHYDVKDYMLSHRLIFSNASSYFNRLLRRINCLAAFYDDVGLREIWDAEVLLEEAYQLAAAAVEVSAKGKCPLFSEVNQTGRLQQLESSAILLAIQSEDYLQAAKIGMRMLVEDSYLLESCFADAAEALLQVMKDEGMAFSRGAVTSTQQSLRRMLKSCRNVSLDTGKNAVFVFELNQRWSNSRMLEELNAECLDLYDTWFSPNDQIAVLASNMSVGVTVELGSKEENEGRQRSSIDVATSLCRLDSIQACLPVALQMLVDSTWSLQSDSFIILVTDGSSLDATDSSAIRSQVEQWNAERTYLINFLIVGIDIEDDRCKSIMESLGTVSRNSSFVHADSKDLTPAFRSISALLHGHTSNQLISFLTMEKF